MARSNSAGIGYISVLTIVYIIFSPCNAEITEPVLNPGVACTRPLWELATLEEMGTWRLEDLPEGREAIEPKWTFVKKWNERGKVEVYKARLVARGFTQKPGIDFSNTGTFAPVMQFETLRTLLALSAIEGWHLCQIDVKGAYLNGQLTEELYMKQPIGFEDSTRRVCRLVKSIYGLKQAGNVWNHDLNSTMLDFGYTCL